MNELQKKHEIDLIQYWGMIIKRKWVILTFTGMLVFFTGIFSFLATPIYKSTVTLLIEEESSKMLSIDEAFGFQSSVIQDLRFFNTQLKLLKSKSLAERVAKRMNLLARKELSSGNSGKSLTGLIKDFATLKWLKSRKADEGRELKPVPRADAYSSIAESIRYKIEVRPLRDTKLVEVSYSSPDPILAADLINTLAEEFIDFSIEKRFETTQQASNFLNEQISNLQEELVAKQKELQRYGQEKEIFFLSDAESTAVNKFASLNAAYTQAQINRINAEATYRELRDLDVESLPQFVNNPVIQQFKTEYSRMKNDYEEKSKIFKPDYPEMIQLRAKLESMKEELKNEIRKAVEAAETEYRSALNREQSLLRLLEQQRSDVVRMDSNAILYNSLKIEVENMRRLLNSLVERRNETLVSARLEGFKTSNITIIDRAEVPKKPVSPKKKLNLILAFLIGLFGGVGLCFVLEYLDNTIKGPEDVEKLVGLPSLGIIPYLPSDEEGERKTGSKHYGYSYGEKSEKKDEAVEVKRIELVNHLYPNLSISEDYKTVRTSILLSHADNPPKTLLFTSSLPREGKTVTVVNMAVSFSQLDEKVLVVDADLRKPRLHRIFKARNTGGLSSYLTGKLSLKDIILKTSIPNIWLLPSGPIPPNPAELLNSKKMKEMLEEIKKGYDIILIDTPPVLAVIDTLIVSNLVDCIVFIIKAGKTTKKPFRNSIEELRRAKSKIIGVVFNELKVKKGDYYFMNYYRYHQYNHYGNEEG